MQSAWGVGTGCPACWEGQLRAHMPVWDSHLRAHMPVWDSHVTAALRCKVLGAAAQGAQHAGKGSCTHICQCKGCM
eukprot:1143426-Pelagomonas_calceolata.AAC.7